MSQNNSTFDAGFNIVTPDFSALDSRYFRISERLGELSGSTYISTSISASRNIFGSGSNVFLTDCTIKSSGSGCILRFNGITSSYDSANWQGAIVYDTNQNHLYTRTGTKWISIIDSTGGTVEGNLNVSGSYVFNITSSVGSKIGIAHPNYTLLELSASTSDSNIITKNDLYIINNNTKIGKISTDGSINFTSGSFNLGNGSNTVNGNLTVNGFLSASTITCSGDIIAFSTSDERLKDNIARIDDPLAKVLSISGNTFDWNEKSNKSGHDVGVIAQEIEEVLPQIVTTRENGYKAVKYEKLVALLIEGIKEQQSQIHSLTLEVENLKKNNSL